MENGNEYKFERRWYGKGIAYTWAWVKFAGEWISLGDPWPSKQWPKKELAKFTTIAIEGKYPLHRVSI